MLKLEDQVRIQLYIGLWYLTDKFQLQAMIVSLDLMFYFLVDRVSNLSLSDSRDPQLEQIDVLANSSLGLLTASRK